LRTTDFLAGGGGGAGGGSAPTRAVYRGPRAISAILIIEGQATKRSRAPRSAPAPAAAPNVAPAANPAAAGAQAGAAGANAIG
ncbi:MAG TPA: hypothetical protein VFH92_01650, partial [Phenylobacterium sp.]|nr:hypothetical protein [Phenylobacterium sp.]